MRKFNAIKREHFYPYLKECKWRFNTKKLSIMKAQLLQWIDGGF
jgi:transposase-like protein